MACCHVCDSTQHLAANSPVKKRELLSQSGWLGRRTWASDVCALFNSSGVFSFGPRCWFHHVCRECGGSHSVKTCSLKVKGGGCNEQVDGERHLYIALPSYISPSCFTLVVYIMGACRAWASKQALVYKQGQDKTFGCDNSTLTPPPFSSCPSLSLLFYLPFLWFYNPPPPTNPNPGVPLRELGRRRKAPLPGQLRPLAMHLSPFPGPGAAYPSDREFADLIVRGIREGSRIGFDFCVV